MKRILLTTCAPIFLLSACANPQVVKPLTSEDYKLSCEQISQEIGAAEFAERNAREDDRFKASYILIAPAIISYFRMSDAESAAQNRTKGLEDIAMRKGCSPHQNNLTPSAQEGNAPGTPPSGLSAQTAPMMTAPPAAMRAPYPAAPMAYPPAANYPPRTPSGFPPAPMAPSTSPYPPR